MIHLEDGCHHYGSRLQFKGSVVEGQGGRIEFGGSRRSFDAVPVAVRFGISFANGSLITYFENREGGAYSI